MQDNEKLQIEVGHKQVFLIYPIDHMLEVLKEGRYYDLVKLKHLRGRKLNAHVMRKGRVWKGDTLVVRWLPIIFKDGVDPAVIKKNSGLFVGTMASAKLNKSAVKRNRMRRRCKEALRKAVIDRNENDAVQLLLCPRSRSLTCDFSDIQSDVERFLSTL